MKKRRLALLVAVGLLAWVSAAVLPPKVGVTATNFCGVRKGMSRQQVEAILGPGRATGWAFPPGEVTDCSWEGEHCSVRIRFFGGEVTGGVFFTDDGKVLTLEPEPTSFWERLRGLLPWLRARPGS